jgi:hypothetical protein
MLLDELSRLQEGIRKAKRAVQTGQKHPSEPEQDEAGNFIIDYAYLMRNNICQLWINYKALPTNLLEKDYVYLLPQDEAKKIGLI